MRILVTGGAGYVGSVLLPKLLARGHQVRVLDVGYFGMGHLKTLTPAVEIVRDDIRRVISDSDFRNSVLQSCDSVIHLAAVSNDPSADLNPELTEEVNFQATAALAEAARTKRIRFLFSSSCSVYGEGQGDLDENGAIHPLTTYALSKVKAERMLEQAADSNWKPVILRNGTLFGYSPRMRFDLVVNIFSLYSTLHNEIKVFGDGRHWRPFLHVGDCARAFAFFVERPECLHRCYNIAHENLRVLDLAETFKRLNPRLNVSRVDGVEADRRDYRVTTARMSSEGFRTRVGVESGAEEMNEAIVSGVINDPESIYYRNAKWLKELTNIGARNHRDVVTLMETLAHMKPPQKSA